MIKRLPFLLIGMLLFLTAVAVVYYGYQWGYSSDLPPNQPLSSFVSNILHAVLPLGLLLLIIVGFGIWLAALIHMLKNHAIQGTEKIVWALVIIFLHILGAIVYFAIAPRSTARPITFRRPF